MIGREEERTLLKSLLTAPEHEFVVVYGRRRVGKTYLIRESYEYNFTFQHTGVNNGGYSSTSDSMKQRQLNKFADSLREYGISVEQPLKDWDTAFSYLKELIKKSPHKKKVIFIDELSWMDTKNSGLLSALESFWNSWVTARKEKDVVLILCSSATYWMIDKIVNSKGGLHNRLTRKIHVHPFSLRECELYTHELGIEFNRHQLMQCYMILGGVPYYWSHLQKGMSFAQNIDRLFFSRDALLDTEYDNLYRALFNSPDQYIKIIDTLSNSTKGMSRDSLSQMSGIANSGDFSKKLRELENCGFIRKYTGFGHKTRNCMYQLIDNFTLFYHKFLKNKSSDEHYWLNNLTSSSVYAWSGIAFERVCLQHIDQIKKKLGISGVYSEVFAWSCKENLDEGILGSQIDLIIDRRDKVINICEIKFSENEYLPNKEFDSALKRKVSDFKKVSGTRSVIHTTLVASDGVITNSYSGNIQSVVIGDDLFE